jgi:hypothetical protein
MDKTERDRLDNIFKIVVVVCLSMCYIVYEYTRQVNFPTLITQCETSCESYGRMDYVVYGKCQCISKYNDNQKIEEKKNSLWAYPNK